MYIATLDIHILMATAYNFIQSYGTELYHYTSHSTEELYLVILAQSGLI